MKIDKAISENRKRLQQPENQLRGMTEATGLMILDGVYQLIKMLHWQAANEAEKFSNDINLKMNNAETTTRRDVISKRLSRLNFYVD